MDDAFLVGVLERAGDLRGEGQSFVERNPAAGDPLGQRGPLDQLRGQCTLYNPIDRGKARMGNNRRMRTHASLAEIVRRLQEAYPPERIYLFGSSTRGGAGPDSDYDLMVVVPDDAMPSRRRSRLAL